MKSDFNDCMTLKQFFNSVECKCEIVPIRHLDYNEIHYYDYDLIVSSRFINNLYVVSIEWDKNCNNFTIVIV